MLTTLRQRNFALLWFAGLISMMGDWVLFIAIMIALIVQPTLTAKKTSETQSAAVLRPRLWQDWLAGLRLIRSNRVVSVIFFVMGIAAIAEGIFNVLFVVFVRQKLGGDALEFGWLTSAQAVGGLLGGLLIGWLGNRAPPNRLAALLAVNGVLVLILINLPSFPLAIVLLFMAGVPIVGYSVGVDTLLQQHVTDQYRGRVFGALATSVAVFLLLGQGLASGLGDYVGVAPLLNVKGILDIGAGLFAWIWLYRVSGRS